MNEVLLTAAVAGMFVSAVDLVARDVARGYCTPVQIAEKFSVALDGKGAVDATAIAQLRGKRML